MLSPRGCFSQLILVFKVTHEGETNDKHLSDLHEHIHAFQLIWRHSLKLAFHLQRQQIITQSVTRTNDSLQFVPEHKLKRVTEGFKAKREKVKDGRAAVRGSGQ